MIGLQYEMQNCDKVIFKISRKKIWGFPNMYFDSFFFLKEIGCRFMHILSLDQTLSLFWRSLYLLEEIEA